MSILCDKCRGEKRPQTICLVPCYNEEKRLPKFIASMRAQTVPVHILAVDDGSTDATSREMNRGCDYQIYSHENNYPRSFNKMVDYLASDVIRYEYLMWGGADEVHYPKSIEKRIKFCEENDVDVVVAGTDQVFKDGKVMNWPDCLPQFERLKTADLSIAYVELMFRNFFPWPIFVRLKNVALADVRMDETLFHLVDWDQNIRLAKKYKIGFLNEALQVEEWDDHNLSSPRQELYEEKSDEARYIRFKQLVQQNNERRINESK